MSKQTLRDQLLQLDSFTWELEAKYQKEKMKMFEKTLNSRQKVVWTLSGMLGVFFFIFFGYTAFTAPAGFNLIIRGTFIFGAIFGAAWTGLSFYILKKSSFHIIKTDNAINGLTFMFMVIFMTAILLVTGKMEDKTLAILMVVQGSVFFMMFGIPAILNMRMNRMESNIREQMLKLELKLAEREESENNS